MCIRDSAHGVALDFRARHLGTQADIKSLFLELALRLLRDLLVDDGKKVGERLEYGEFAAQAAPYAAKFQADDARTDDAESLRHRVQVERAAGIHDGLAVKGRRAQFRRHRAGGQHDMLCSKFAPCAVVGGELHPPARQELAMALQRRDSARLEERQDALRAGLDNAALPLLHLRHIEACARGAYAVDRELLAQTVIELGGLKQRLRWDAADVETRAAKHGQALAVLPFVDAGDRELVLRGTDRRRIAGRTPADDDDVK